MEPIQGQLESLVHQTNVASSQRECNVSDDRSEMNVIVAQLLSSSQNLHVDECSCVHPYADSKSAELLHKLINFSSNERLRLP